MLKHVGPVEGGLAEAFTFATLEGSRTRRRGAGKRKTADDGSPVKATDVDIENELANAGALWANAEDFWKVIGWAFNCSIVHKTRWEVWRAWLAYMLEVVECDCELRGLGTALEMSLIVKYIKGDGSARRNEKRILRAVFADGSSKSTGEFGEVWKNETRELKKNADALKAEKRINIEADDYGDYLDEENEDDLEDSASTSSSPRNGTKQVKHNRSKDFVLPSGADTLGGLDAFNLRLRILSLLSNVSFSIPDSFIPIKSLYDLYLDHIRPLPLPTFFLFMAEVARARIFHASVASSLTQYILLTILAADAPQPENDTLSQDTLEQCYLPFAANTTSIVDNTKVSLCVEALLRLLDFHCDGRGLDWTPDLQDAAEMGIKARQVKVKRLQGRRGMNSDDGVWLADSAERIRMVVAMAQHPASEDHDVDALSSD